ncbi:ethanolamine utilization microcompartment protein EutL [Alkalibaculum sp. M08DMB]|uniref:Ethanolamine utilization microcompartment protein EutL n=1 Tax=Alkalibaculum sporogenes TaxID=2655001 RepID=A0A6A7K816_9FIRM|nr:ethanolamine utilization microcompartment protein EutL [Alkalibaculum sporogenes]
MLGDIIRANVVCQKIIPNVSEDIAKELKLKPHQKSLGLITGSIDDVTFIALDEATKSAEVEIVYAECLFSALVGNYTKLAGEAIGILAGPSPAEVKSGLEICENHIKNGAFYVNANDEGESIYLAHCISSVGTFLADLVDVPVGTAMAYCIAPPVEAIYAVDAALKAADVRVVKSYLLPPLNTCNFAGALMVGSQSACQAACDAFADACKYVVASPMSV